MGRKSSKSQTTSMMKLSSQQKDRFLKNLKMKVKEAQEEEASKRIQIEMGSKKRK